MCACTTHILEHLLFLCVAKVIHKPARNTRSAAPVLNKDVVDHFLDCAQSAHMCNRVVNIVHVHSMHDYTFANRLHTSYVSEMHVFIGNYYNSIEALHKYAKVHNKRMAGNAVCDDNAV
jgi:hypothetical protein